MFDQHRSILFDERVYQLTIIDLSVNEYQDVETTNRLPFQPLLVL